MKKQSRKTILARKYLPLVAVLLRIINEVLDILSKVVNYARPLRELRV